MFSCPLVSIPCTLLWLPCEASCSRLLQLAFRAPGAFSRGPHKSRRSGQSRLQSSPDRAVWPPLLVGTLSPTGGGLWGRDPRSLRREPEAEPSSASRPRPPCAPSLGGRLALREVQVPMHGSAGKTQAGEGVPGCSHFSRNLVGGERKPSALPRMGKTSQVPPPSFQ